ncbi:GntR family transcriptional regulator [Variovorax sp. LG9.2]|uniref:GntR family transcriptional regulator n=1 Tax=Variovorax sp. LG9.2 TaxID=3048626 RepID=UPI002B22DAF9|nr:GntR family transcriptional regulator [Variovorax sp. LG9.2]MEB0059829.1 GntR family transcriptional regulator [Variovorax sp. LG9.2]
MDDTPLTRESLNGQAYNRLCRDLKAGRFAPGEKLKLRDLAAEMGISPTPVREALARLISEQALEQVGHHSVRVPLMSEERFAEVRALRLMLEGRAAALAAKHAEPADIRRLEAIHERMAARHDARDTAGELLEAERFHMAVYALARMPVLQRMVEGLWLQCGPLMRALQTHALAQPRKQHPHHLVLRGLRKHDGEVARRGVEEEIERTSAPILAYLRGRGAAAATPARKTARVAA